MSTKLHHVEAQIEAPKGDFEGRTVQGIYTLEDGVVTLVSHAGVPVRDHTGKMYSEKVESGADPRAVAARLTKTFRRVRLNEKVEGFSRKLHYPKIGII